MSQQEQESRFSVACPECSQQYQVPVSFRGRRISCKGCGKGLLLEPQSPSESGPGLETASSGFVVESVEEESPCLLLGRLALKHRFLDQEQLKEAIAEQQKEKQQGKQSLLGSILVRKGFITQKHLDFLLSIQLMSEVRGLDLRFGVIAVENGFINSEDMDAALKEQVRIFKEKRAVKLVGEILVERGKMEPGSRDAVLKVQNRLFPDKENEVYAPAEPSSIQSPEPPSDPLDELFRVEFSPDGLTASVATCGPPPETLTAAELKAWLERHEVIYGLLPHEALEALIREDLQAGGSHTVAQGTPPRAGSDARIFYHFDTDPLKVGTIKEGGNIDFRDKGEIPRVNKGDLLVERVPPVEGTPGMDVKGRPVLPPKPRNRRIRRGKGTVLSEDGLQLTADQSGRPEVSADGKVFVFSEYKVRGDVDLKSGHVDFEGDIYVNGTVQKGFRVRGGKLTAKEIVGAEILVRGDVMVTGGIIGADIRIGGNLRAGFMNKSRVRAFGDVVIEKEAIDVDVETSGAFILRAGSVYSSRVIAKKGIVAAQVGSDNSNPCLFVVGTDDRVQNEIKDIQAGIDRTLEEREALFKKIETLDRQKQDTALEFGKHVQQLDSYNVKKRELEKKIGAAQKMGNEALLSKIEQAVHILEKKIQEGDEALESYFSKEESVNEEILARKREIEDKDERIKTLNDEIEHIEAWSKSEEPLPVVNVFGKIYPYTVIKGRDTALTLPECHQGLRIKETHFEDPVDGKEWKFRLSPLKK